MGLHKICTHKGRARDRCTHAWWGSFRGKRVSLANWTTREIRSKNEADKAAREGARSVQHHRLPAEAFDRAIRASADRQPEGRRLVPLRLRTSNPHRPGDPSVSGWKRCT